MKNIIYRFKNENQCKKVLSKYKHGLGYMSTHRLKSNMINKSSLRIKNNQIEGWNDLKDHLREYPHYRFIDLSLKSNLKTYLL